MVATASRSSCRFSRSRRSSRCIGHTRGPRRTPRRSRRHLALDCGRRGVGRFDSWRACWRGMSVGRRDLCRQRAGPARHTVHAIGPERASCLPVEGIVAVAACRGVPRKSTRAHGLDAAGAARGLGGGRELAAGRFASRTVKLATTCAIHTHPAVGDRVVAVATCGAFHVVCVACGGSHRTTTTRGAASARGRRRTVDVSLNTFRAEDGIIAIAACTRVEHRA